MEWILFAYNGDQWLAVVNAMMKPGSMKGEPLSEDLLSSQEGLYCS